MSVKSKLQLEALTDRIVPAAYPTATVPSDWAEFSPASVVMDEDPGLTQGGVAAQRPAGRTAQPSQVPVPDPGSFKDINEIKDKLKKNPDGKKLLEDFEKDKGTVKKDESTFSGGYFDPVGNGTGPVIGINPNKTGPTNDPTSVLLYELLRYKYSKDQLDLDKQAKAGTLTKDEYAKKCEELTYKYAQEHSAIAKKGIADGTFDANVDRFGKKLDKGGEWETFDKYLDYAKNGGHYKVFQDRYDSLRK